MAKDCPKYAISKHKCLKCGGLHKIINCGSRCNFCGGLGHTEKIYWKKTNLKTCAITTNYLEVMVDDEEIVRNQLDQICGNNHDLFSHTMVPRRKLPLDMIVREPESVELPYKYLSRMKELEVGYEATIGSNSLIHFIKGKISLTLMETILIILG
jgi:hypothetical protein